MSRIISTIGGSTASLSTSDLHMEFLGFDSTPTGMNNYVSSFDRTAYIGYHYIVFGTGSGSNTSFQAQFRNGDSNLGGTAYSFTYIQPTSYYQMSTFNSQASFYFPNSYFINSALGHPTVRVTAFLRPTNQADLEMEMIPATGAGYSWSRLAGSYYNSSDTVRGIRLAPTDGSTFGVGGGVYRFGMRRR